MALVKCSDCENEVSESAAFCPKCGAPVAKKLGPDDEQCPFCMSVISNQATVCPGCKAQKGYTQANGVVYNKSRTIMMGIIVPALIVLFALMFQTTFGYLVALVFAIPLVLSARRIKTGPVWFQKRSVY